MICGPHLTMDPGSLSRALKYGRYCLPSLKYAIQRTCVHGEGTLKEEQPNAKART